MAKKSMINKQQRPQKFKVREYTRCERCGRPHSVLRNTNYVVFASVNWLTKVKFLELKRLVGKEVYCI